MVFLSYQHPSLGAAKNIKVQLKNFGLESSIDLLYPGIVRSIAHTRSPPWMIFSYYNETSLGDIMEIVSYPAHLAKMPAIEYGGGKVKLSIATKMMASEDKLQRGINVFLHTPSLIHAFVQALVYAHGKGYKGITTPTSKDRRAVGMQVFSMY